MDTHTLKKGKHLQNRWPGYWPVRRAIKQLIVFVKHLQRVNYNIMDGRPTNFTATCKL